MRIDAENGNKVRLPTNRREMELNKRDDDETAAGQILSRQENRLEKEDGPSEQVTQLDRVLAVPMFVVSFAFLIGTAGLFHLTEGDFSSPLAIKILVGLGALYLLLIAEAIAHYRTGATSMRQHLRFLLVPPMRICPRDHATGEFAWIPGLGWRNASGKLEALLARMFSAPMIIIALLVLPVVGAEFVYADKIAESTLGRSVINICSAFIWTAFVFEFVIMFSVVKKRVQYCRQHWIDIAVILLPLVSFLGAARLGRLVKLNQLTRTAKIYRMRGLAIRAWRAVVALDGIDTILRRDPEYRVEKLRVQIEEREKEIEHMRVQLKTLEASIVVQSDSEEDVSNPEVPKPNISKKRRIDSREKILL